MGFEICDKFKDISDFLIICKDMYNICIHILCINKNVNLLRKLFHSTLSSACVSLKTSEIPKSDIKNIHQSYI